MKSPRQFVIATLAALVVLVIFVYPLTAVLPAPHQNYWPISLLLAPALCAMVALVETSSGGSCILELPWPHANLSSERLALICTHLC